MPEKIIETSNKELSPDLNRGELSREQLENRYYDYNNARVEYENDGQQIYDAIKNLSTLNAGTSMSESDRFKIDKLKNYFELDEAALSDIENDMSEIERRLGYGPDMSSRFDTNKMDVLVCSAFLYRDRLELLKESTGNPDIDEPFVDVIIKYAKAVERDESSKVHMLYEDDIQKQQEYFQNCQRRRSMLHNDMIKEFNVLNDLARANNLKPFMYRDLITNSAANNFTNNEQMYHDRITLARYVNEMIGFNDNKKLPDPRYIKET